MTGFAVLILVLVVFNSNLLGIIWYNDTDIGFGNAAAQFASTISPNPELRRLKECINESAANFLDSYSKWVQYYTNGDKVPGKKGEEDNKFESNLDGAIEYMARTKKSFSDLVQIANKIDYCKPVILKFKNFNYDQFPGRKEIIREDVFEEVKKLLSKGDIRGMYNKTLPVLENILTMSKDIRSKLKAGKSILSDLEDLKQLYSEAMFQGQYATQVCGEIKKERAIMAITIAKMIHR
jgi:hypothetical protein